MSRKEIENYILIPQVIFLITKCDQGEYKNFLKKYNCEIDKLKNDVIDQYSNQIHLIEKGKSLVTVNKQARRLINSKWTVLEEKLKLVNGKDALKITNAWIRTRYKKNCSAAKIISLMKPDDISQDLKSVIDILLE